MNKKQEALRRGLRSFIEDASRELADLEGREPFPRRRDVVEDAVMPPVQDESPPPAPQDPASVPPAQDATPVAGPDTTSAASPRVATAASAAQDAATVSSSREGPLRSDAPDTATAPLSQDATLPPAGRGSVIVPLPQDATLPPAAQATVIIPPSSQGTTLPPVARGASTAPMEPDAAQQLEPMQAVAPALGGGVAAPTQAESTSDRPAEVHGKGGQGTSRGERRKRPRARPRQRAAPSIGVDGMGMLNVRSRKGVCSAYFINEQCWQLPEAYCNTALQVCITRECPVYHLHKEALERRFAGKFKHLW